MAQSQLALYNLALDAAGMDYVLSSPTEQSIGAEKCNLWYEPTRQAVLRAAHWNSSKKYARLVLKAERDTSVDWDAADPEPGWGYSYELPGDYLYARFLSDWQPFSISNDSTGRVLSANWGSDTASERPLLAYTFDQDDPSKWEPDLYIAMAHVLAANLVMGITGKVARRQQLIAIATQLVNEARATNANEYSQLWTFMPDSLAARGYSGPMVESHRFVYPYGTLFTATGAPTT